MNWFDHLSLEFLFPPSNFYIQNRNPLCYLKTYLLCLSLQFIMYWFLILHFTLRYVAVLLICCSCSIDRQIDRYIPNFTTNSTKSKFFLGFCCNTNPGSDIWPPQKYNMLSPYSKEEWHNGYDIIGWKKQYVYSWLINIRHLPNCSQKCLLPTETSRVLTCSNRNSVLVFREKTGYLSDLLNRNYHISYIANIKSTYMNY